RHPAPRRGRSRGRRGPHVSWGGEGLPVKSTWAAARNFQQRHSRLVGISFATLVTAVIVIALWGKRHDFTTAFEEAPLWLLACAVGLQIVALLTRTEAWRICVLAAGGTIGRRRLYRASSMGYV